MARVGTWQKTTLGFLAAGIAVSAWLYFRSPGRGAAEAFTASLLALAFAWTGALIGAVVDWRLTGRSPMTPFFKGGFSWYYKRRYWFRFGILFGTAWAGFLLFAEALALAVGEKEEARLFFSLKGGLLLAIFLIVFVLEGALIGGAIDFFKYLAGKK